MARIGNSVYRDICTEDDPLCSNFGFEDYDLSRPTPMMRMSLLYNLHVSGEHPSPAIDNMFRLAYRSRHGLVKIYKVMNVSAESKAGWRTRRTASATRQGRGCALGSTRQRRRSRRCWRGASTTASWRTSTAANETTRTTVRTCVASAMKGVARDRGNCALERKLDSGYVVCARKGPLCLVRFPDDLPHPTIFLFCVRALQ
ncbi:hypothetical protein TcBrA4_0099020 [Trypanosoma cruzi]|nr:hypothetical protein TcBrA4_0099020 [Trypanosoma cruzi]